jgi:hypothetical protein
MNILYKYFLSEFAYVGDLDVYCICGVFIHSFIHSIHLFACEKSFTSSEEQDTDYCPLCQ